MRFLSLFSGCGGFDLGFINQGFRPVGAFDNDKSAFDNYRLNIGDHIELADLRQGLLGENRFKGVEVMIAGPPCQGFSTAGKRDINDERNSLLSLTAEIAIRINPKILVVENVPGSLSGAHSKYWEKMNLRLVNSGYKTHKVTYDTSDLGMAQKRKRVLFFAWKTQNDIVFKSKKCRSNNIKTALRNIRGASNHEPIFLEENSKDWKIANRISQGQKLSNVRGGENAIATWQIPEVFGPVTQKEITILELIRQLRRTHRIRTHGDADPVSYSRLREALGSNFENHVKKLIAKGYLRETEDAIDLCNTFNGKYRRLSWTGLSSTVDTRFGSPRYFLHPKYNRGFTVREAARLQGFDDDYIFNGARLNQYRVIGNAVPPPLAIEAANLTKRLLGR